MRILYYSAHPDLATRDPAGYATHMLGLVGGLTELGHEVRMLVAGDDRAPAATDRAGGPPRRRFARRLFPKAAWQTLRDLRILRHDRALRPRLEAAIREHRPDFVYERAAWLCSSGVRACGDAGVPLLLELNAPYVEERARLGARSLLPGTGRRWERRVLNGATRVLVVSGALGEHYRRRHSVAGPRLRVLPNAVDPADFDPAGAHPGLRASLGIPDEAFVAGYVGGFLAWHGLDRLLEAAAIAARDGPPLHVLLVGDGPERGRLEALAARTGVADRVVFAGAVPRDRVPAHLGAVDVAVVPGHEWYCSPIKLFEYGAMAVPVVAADTAPVREILEDGREGILVGPAAGDLARGIAEVRRDPEAATRRAAAFREKLLREHTWAANARRVVAWAGGG